VAGEQEAWIRWSLRTLLGGPAYVATLATEGTDYRLVAQPCSHSPEECTCLVELLTHCTPMPDTFFL
jgi:hypothetical protein